AGSRRPTPTSAGSCARTSARRAWAGSAPTGSPTAGRASRRRAAEPPGAVPLPLGRPSRPLGAAPLTPRGTSPDAGRGTEPGHPEGSREEGEMNLNGGRRLGVLAAVLLAAISTVTWTASAAGDQARTQWLGSWATSPLPPDLAGPSVAGFTNQTLRE